VIEFPPSWILTAAAPAALLIVTSPMSTPEFASRVHVPPLWDVTEDRYYLFAFNGPFSIGVVLLKSEDVRDFENNYLPGANRQL